MRILTVKKQFIFICLLICSSVIPQVFAQSSTNAVRNTTAPTKTKAENFPKQIQVEGVKLSLNGLGTRYKAIFKVYDMGLYTTSKVTTLQDVIAAPGPKRLHFVALRELPGTDLGILFLRGMRENSSPELNTKYAASANRLVEIFSGKSKLIPDESFSIEFVPGKGTTFYIMDKPQGAAIGDAEFFAMILRIWLGPVPADYKLKDALLGAAS
ncbi:MAG: chalcone isomerase family protein [Burkholderiaceae bacterium]